MEEKSEQKAFEESSEIPPWGVADLPEPAPLEWRHWARFIGPGIVMMGIQIGGGEWLLGPTVTAKYGGGLMWIATIAIVVQVFYNLECGRYALYCGEPVFTGFMRCRPGATFWFAIMFLLNSAALVPGLSTHAAAMIASLILDRPVTPADKGMITGLSYTCLFLVAAPILLGGKVYNTLQGIMTFKVIVVLGFCAIISFLFVSAASWWNVFSGFGKFGTVPIVGPEGKEVLANALSYRYENGEWPTMSMASIVAIGAFAGYAGGGGLANSTYSNFVRDKGWGMGSQVGAIPSAIGGRSVTLSHVGKVFELTPENLRRWRLWWRYILTDQVAVWGPGCFMGMAFPALLSMQFAKYSAITEEQASVAQAMITADGLRHADFSPAIGKLLWILAILTGLTVMLPSQMSIVDDFSRRWTDGIWSSSRLVRGRMKSDQVKYIYYSILGGYVLWSYLCAAWFSNVPQIMTNFIANMNNVAIGFTSFQLLWINHRLLPREIRPNWIQSLGVLACGVFYLGLALLVFVFKIWPMITDALWRGSGAA